MSSVGEVLRSAGRDGADHGPVSAWATLGPHANARRRLTMRSTKGCFYRSAAVHGNQWKGTEPCVLDVVVQLELVRVGAELHGGDLLGALEVDPRVDQVGREDVASGEELVVGLE